MEKFWQRVEKTDSCWLWLGPKDKAGYGLTKIRVNGRWITKRAHVVSFNKDIPAGMQCDHTCNNTGCVNPDHIEVTTPWENNRRGNSAAAKNARKTHCSNGHELVDGAYYLVKRLRSVNPERVCKICLKNRKDKYLGNK
jgi:hypothetical protein